jgi:hypothetical protein
LREVSIWLSAKQKCIWLLGPAPFPVSLFHFPHQGIGAKVYADLRAAGNGELRRKSGRQFKMARQQHNSCLSPSGEAILTFTQAE